MSLQMLHTGFHIMTKPIGPICNLDCRYCFYLEKENYYASDRKVHPSWAMSPETLERYIQQYIEAQPRQDVQFAWQGGEPTLLGVGYFENVVRLQAKYANGKRIQNAFQTNGTLLDDTWGQFLFENQFLVGISIDGPADLHDAYRVDKQQRPTFARVMNGISVLCKHKVDFNTLTVVNRKNSQQPERVYQFLKEIGSGYIQFIPLVERNIPDVSRSVDGLIQLHLAKPAIKDDDAESPVTDWSVRSIDYGRFLCTVFDGWVRSDVGKVFVQHFDVALGNWYGAPGALCVFSETCGKALAMEHNGDVYSCDHYVYPEYRLGNINETSLLELVTSPDQQNFGNAKRDSLPKQCIECDVRFACHGECPKHRFTRTSAGEFGLNYLCAGYKMFFKHIDEPMKIMCQLLSQQRPPSMVMDWARRQTTAVHPTIGRNDPCPCGSGLKAKRCCG